MVFEPVTLVLASPLLGDRLTLDVLSLDEAAKPILHVLPLCLVNGLGPRPHACVVLVPEHGVLSGKGDGFYLVWLLLEMAEQHV